MKNYMKKIIVGFFSLALLFVGATSVSASTLWNGAPNDCPTVAVANYTTQVGYVNPCWPLTSVSAGPGNTINVRVYYHNSSDLNGGPAQTATNVRVVLNASSGTSTTHTFSGQITSDQGNISFGPVTVNLASAQTLTFGSTRWYPNQTQTQATLPGGQSGSEIIGGGLSIGSVSAGWASQGSIVTSFVVGSNIPQTCQDPSANNYGGPLPCTYYVQTCQDPSANNYGGSLPCTYYNQSYCTISNFTANGSTGTLYISSNDPVTISWNTYNCYSASISGQGIYSNNSNLSGSQTVYPTYSGDYIINAYGNNGSPSRTIRVNVNNNNQSYCTISSFTANSSSSTTINSGNPVTIAWNTYGCTSVNVSGPGLTNYYNNLSGSQTVYPTYSGTYTISAYGNNGSPSRTAYVYVNPTVIVPPPPVYTNTCAVTSVATNITKNSATLNGILTNPTGSSYFDYGTSVGLGLRTVSRTSTGLFSEPITGLAPDTFYYFRPVSQCARGLSYGNIEVFKTLGNVINTVKPIIIQGTTVIGTESPIMLKIENRYQAIGVGDTIDYTVTYKNVGKKLLTHPILQVIVPKGISITNASRGTAVADTNTLTTPIEDLIPGAEGVVYLQGHVDSILSNTAQVVTTAILVYTSPNSAQENAIAYVLNNPRDFVNENNNLGASAFWAGLRDIGLVGWLLIITSILIITLLARRIGSKPVTNTTH